MWHGSAWHGSVRLGEREVALGLRLTPGGGAQLWLPDQGLRGTAAPLQQEANGALRVEVSSWLGRPTLTLQAPQAGGVRQATFTQGSCGPPLPRGPGALLLPPRPQEPAAPLPYPAREVTVLGAGGTPLRGTLTLPAQRGGPVPAVLLVSGSGPQDRDSSLSGHRPFLVLADALTRAGFAVLRLDDRGVGRSGGDLYRTPYRDLSLDLQAGVAFLRGLGTVDAARVGLIGHSEGGLLVLQAAQELTPPPAFMVLLATPAVPGREVLRVQLQDQLRARGKPPAEIATQTRLQALALSGEDAGHYAAAAQATSGRESPPSGSEIEQAWLYAQPFARSPYLQDFLAYDPRPALRATHMPTLAIFGGLDRQVPRAAGAGPMRDLLRCQGCEVREIAGLNHLLQPAQSGLPEEYASIPTTLDPRALDLLVRWLREAAHP